MTYELLLGAAPWLVFSVAECSASVVNTQKQCNALKQNICLECTCTKVSYTAIPVLELLPIQQKMH